MPQPDRRWIGRVLLVLGSVVLTLLVVEILVIVLWDEPTADYRGREIYPTNPRGYFEADGQGRFVLRTDRRQHRCQAPPDPADVLFVGDSFTYGEGVRVEHTVTSRLRDAGLRIRNCARPGNDLGDHLDVLREQAPGSPRLVVLALVLNDLCGIGPERPGHVRVEAGPDGGIVDDGVWVRSASRETYIAERQADLGGWRWLLGSVAFRWMHRRWVLADLARHTEEVYRRCWQPTELLEAQLDSLVKAGRAYPSFAVVVWPMFVSLSDYPWLEAHATIRSAFERRGVPVFDLLEVFQDRDADDLIVHPLDRHPNEEAHRLAAEALAPWLTRLLLCNNVAPRSP